MKNLDNTKDPRDVIIAHLVDGFKDYCVNSASEIDLAHLYETFASCCDCPIFCGECFEEDCYQAVICYLLEKRSKK